MNGVRRKHTDFKVMLMRCDVWHSPDHCFVFCDGSSIVFMLTFIFRPTLIKDSGLVDVRHGCISVKTQDTPLHVQVKLFQEARQEAWEHKKEKTQRKTRKSSSGDFLTKVQTKVQVNYITFVFIT